MKILVTGGAGYIGSNLTDALIADGHEVWALDNLSTGSKANILHLSGEERFHWVHDSILNRAVVDQLASKVDQIYHLAAVVGVKYVIGDPLGGIRTNVAGTEIVLECAHKYGKRTVIASSSEVYGKSPSVPWSEEDDCLLGPTTVSRWSYALSKAIDEHCALAYARRGLQVAIVRYFNSYGPRLDPQGYGSVVARFISQALSGEPLTVYDDGQQTRCFTYVDDTVQGTILAGTMPAAVGKVFNIGSEDETKILELAHLIRDLTGSRSDIACVPNHAVFGENFEETRRRVPDNRRAADLLGFRAQVSLREGLAKTIGWFRNRRTDQAEDLDLLPNRWQMELLDQQADQHSLEG